MELTQEESFEESRADECGVLRVPRALGGPDPPCELATSDRKENEREDLEA